MYHLDGIIQLNFLPQPTHLYFGFPCLRDQSIDDALVTDFHSVKKMLLKPMMHTSKILNLCSDISQTILGVLQKHRYDKAKQYHFVALVKVSCDGKYQQDVLSLFSTAVTCSPSLPFYHFIICRMCLP